MIQQDYKSHLYKKRNTEQKYKTTNNVGILIIILIGVIFLAVGIFVAFYLFPLLSELSTYSSTETYPY